MIKLFKHGIYSCHIEGIHCEAKFFNDKLIDCFVDKYKSKIEMNIDIIKVDNIQWVKRRDFNKSDFKK